MLWLLSNSHFQSREEVARHSARLSATHYLWGTGAGKSQPWELVWFSSSFSSWQKYASVMQNSLTFPTSLRWKEEEFCLGKDKLHSWVRQREVWRFNGQEPYWWSYFSKHHCEKSSFEDSFRTCNYPVCQLNAFNLTSFLWSRNQCGNFFTAERRHFILASLIRIPIFKLPLLL